MGLAPENRVTIKQVAFEAGVSTQTVSRVFNNRPDVAPETRQRVQQVIARLGYQPNAIARSLIKQRTHTLGAVVAHLDQYGPQRMLLGIEQQAKELGYSLLLNLVHQPEMDNGELLLRSLLAQQVDGIIWALPAIGHNRNWLHHKNPQLSVPIIFVDVQPHKILPGVTTDHRRGGRMATEHLVAQGYQKIGLITGPLSWHSAQQRYLGWQDALTAANIPPTSEKMVEGDWSAASGQQGLHQLLEQFPDIDAVFASNDQMALGVLQAAHQLGRRIPADLAVVGYDNTPESAYYWPPLTTIRHQMIKQSQIAVNELHRMIEAQQQGEEITPPLPIFLEPQLIIRKTSTIE
jgi:LacI family transcriptional regulator